MQTVYLVTAVLGGAVLVIQTVLSLLGLGEADADLDDGGGGFDPEQHNDFFKFLSLRTLVAFATFFGLTGIACRQAGLGEAATVLVAVAAGTAAFFAVAHLMLALNRLQSEGTEKLEGSLGRSGRVYLRVPGFEQGEGKVTVPLQGRTVECRAVTAGAEIPTGREVTIVEVMGPRRVRVLPVEEHA